MSEFQNNSFKEFFCLVIKWNYKYPVFVDQPQVILQDSISIFGLQTLIKLWESTFTFQWESHVWCHNIVQCRDKIRTNRLADKKAILIGLQNISEEGLISEMVLCFQRSQHRILLKLAVRLLEVKEIELKRKKGCAYVYFSQKLQKTVFMSKIGYNCGLFKTLCLY